MKYLVTQHDYNTKRNNVIFKSGDLFEARQFLENTVFDYIVLKIGDKALQQKEGHYETSTVSMLYSLGLPEVKGTVVRYVPKCLHRQYNTGSQSWMNIDTDYFAIRNPTKGSLYQMTVYKKDLSRGWIYNDINYTRIFDVDIVFYNEDDIEVEQSKDEEESLFVDYQIREIFSHVLEDISKKNVVEIPTELSTNNIE